VCAGISDGGREGIPHEHLPLPVALREAQREEGMMMGWGLPYLRGGGDVTACACVKTQGGEVVAMGGLLRCKLE